MPALQRFAVEIVTDDPEAGELLRDRLGTGPASDPAAVLKRILAIIRAPNEPLPAATAADPAPNAAGPMPAEAVAPQADGSVSMTFTAQAGNSYSLLERDSLDAAHPWIKVVSTPVESASGPVTLSDPNASASAIRFYEIVSPAVP